MDLIFYISLTGFGTLLQELNPIWVEMLLYTLILGLTGLVPLAGCPSLEFYVNDTLEGGSKRSMADLVNS